MTSRNAGVTSSLGGEAGIRVSSRLGGRLRASRSSDEDGLLREK